MKVLFIGLGSIGQRHFYNLLKLLSSVEIHAVRSTPRKLPDDISIQLKKCYNSIHDVDEKYDIVFITNPTIFHYETLKLAIKFSKKIFIEKPVFSDNNVDLKQLKIPSDTILYVAAPLRYTKVYKFLHDFLKEKTVYNVRAICSSYLPEWRSNIDYRECYSAKKNMGGDIELELIHEWDYITDLFGFPNKVFSIFGKYSHLEIDSNDLAVYIAEYKEKVINLTIDYFGRSSRREIELYLPDDVIVGDFIKGEVRFLKSGYKENLTEDRNDFQIKELKYFIELNSNDYNNNTVKHALKVLQLAKGVLV